MATIVRCPTCISLVYDGAEICHHCGEELSRKKRRFFNKGSVLIILLAVTAFGIGDAIYLAKERGKVIRYDKRAIERFMDKVRDDRSGSSVRFGTPREALMAEELRQHFRAELGCGEEGLHKFGIDVGEARWLGSATEFIAWGSRNRQREVEVRRLEIAVSFKEGMFAERQHFFLTVGTTGHWSNVRLVNVSWTGRDTPTIPAKRVSGG